MDSTLQDASNKRDNKQALFQSSSSVTAGSTSLSTPLLLNSQSTNLPSTPTTPRQRNGWPPVALDATARELWSPTTQIYARGWPTAAIPPSPLSFNDFRLIGDSVHPTGISLADGEFVPPSQPIQDPTNPFFYQSAAGGLPPGAETTSFSTSLSSGDSQWQMYLTGSFSNHLDLNALDFQYPNDSVTATEHQEGNYRPGVEGEAFDGSQVCQGMNDVVLTGDGMVASTGRSDGTTPVGRSPVLRPQRQLLETSHEYHGSYLHSPPSEGLPAATASAMPVVSASSSAHHRPLGDGSLAQQSHAFPFASHSNTSSQGITDALVQQRSSGRGPSGSLLRFAQHEVAQGQVSPSQRDSYLQHLPLRLRAPTPLEAPAVPRHSRMAATRTGVGSTIPGGPVPPVSPPATDIGSPPIPRQLFVASTSTGVANLLPGTTYRRGLSGWGGTGNSPPTSQVVHQNLINPPGGRKRQQAPTNLEQAVHNPGSVSSYVAPFNALTEQPSTTSRRPTSSTVSPTAIDLDLPEQLPPRRSKFRKVSHRESSDDDYEPADDGGDSDSDCYLPSRSPSPEDPATSSNEHHSRTADSNKGSVISRNHSSTLTKRKKQGKARGSAALALAVVSQMAQETTFDHSSIDLETHPAVRKRKNHPIPLPVPVPNLNKKSRGRKVPYVVDLSSPGQGGSDVGTVDYVQGHAETPSASSPKVEEDVDDVDEEYATSGQGSVRPSSRRKGSTPAPVLVDGERTYVCVVSGCGKCFVRGEHLKRHVRSIHTHDKPHKCPYHGCGKSFSRRDNLGQHTRIHIQSGV